MSPVLVTGLGGTVGPALQDALARPCVGWDRGAVSHEHPEAVRAHLDALDPEAVCHLALGAESWAAELAGWCARRERPFLFTSTVMVFEAPGPHRVGDEPTARDAYGRYKARCEEAVRAANPGAVVARLGWQIGTARGGNTMLEALHRQAAAGAIRASVRWIPATSFLLDTAAALVELLDRGTGGTFHLDGNAGAAWDYHRIACAVRDRFGERSWRIEPCEDHVDDQRLLDDRSRVRSIADRLGSVG